MRTFKHWRTGLLDHAVAESSVVWPVSFRCFSSLHLTALQSPGTCVSQWPHNELYRFLHHSLSPSLWTPSPMQHKTTTFIFPIPPFAVFTVHLYLGYPKSCADVNICSGFTSPRTHFDSRKQMSNGSDNIDGGIRYHREKKPKKTKVWWSLCSVPLRNIQKTLTFLKGMYI